MDTRSSDSDKELKFAPLHKERIGIFKLKYSSVQELSKRFDAIVTEVVDEYVSDLDEFIELVSALLDRMRDNPKVEFSDNELQRMVVRLPTLMYYLIDVMDRAAIDQDVAKAAVRMLSAEAFDNAVGTIPERKAKADLSTSEESLLEDVTRHVYKRLNGRLEICTNLLDAIKKVMTSRDNEKLVFRRDKQ